MTDQAHFNYDVKIGHGADILRTGPLSQTLENCGEVIITSKPFTSYSDCEKSMNSLMSALSFIESKYSENGHVIVTRLNPLLDTSGKKAFDADTWDKFTVVRAYVANAEKLKVANLEYHVLGQIRVDQVILGLTQPATPLPVPVPSSLTPQPPPPVISLK